MQDRDEVRSREERAQLEGQLVRIVAVDRRVTSVSENSNLLLNIGPRADGTIPREMRQRLLGIGRWLRINGAAIYRTRPWIQPGTESVRFTVRKRTKTRPRALYITALEWPGRRLVVEATIRRARRAASTPMCSGSGRRAGERGGALLLPRG